MRIKYSALILFSYQMIALGSSQALSQSLESMQMANHLGSVIAAEAYCGLSYDQGAVAAYIEQNVKPDDISFPSNLQMMIEGSKFQHQGMSASAKTAHCAQIKRIASTYGFVE